MSDDFICQWCKRDLHHLQPIERFQNVEGYICFDCMLKDAMTGERLGMKKVREAAETAKLSTQA